MDVSTVRWWVVSFSSVNINVKNKPLSADFYERSMQALIHQWQKCIASGGGHAEKECFVAENHAANRYCCALCICNTMEISAMTAE